MYGNALRLTLREEDDDNIVRVFLPRHYGSAMSEGKSTSTDRPMLQMDV